MSHNPELADRLQAQIDAVRGAHLSAEVARARALEEIRAHARTYAQVVLQNSIPPLRAYTWLQQPDSRPRTSLLRLPIPPDYDYQPIDIWPVVTETNLSGQRLKGYYLEHQCPAVAVQTPRPIDSRYHDVSEGGKLTADEGFCIIERIVAVDGAGELLEGARTVSQQTWLDTTSFVVSPFAELALLFDTDAPFQRILEAPRTFEDRLVSQISQI